MKNRGLIQDSLYRKIDVIEALKNAGITEIATVREENDFFKLVSDGRGISIAVGRESRDSTGWRPGCPLLMIPDELPGLIHPVVLKKETTRAAVRLLGIKKGMVRILNFGLGSMVGISERMRGVFKSIEKVGPSDLAVLIRGESGTGKELAAYEIHRLSRRANKPFITVNCGALSPSLLQSELFGHEKGAFTGALKARVGRFETADKGTIFLDEIDSADMTLQANLLRIIEQKQFERVGSSRSNHVDVRIIAATNANLEEKVEQGSFRLDLYYRLRGYEIELPPLRERNGDIELLTECFIAGNGPSDYRYEFQITNNALETLKKHQWPGNVRELRHSLMSAMINSENGVIKTEDLPPSVVNHKYGNASGREFSRWLIGRVRGAVAGDPYWQGNLYQDVLETVERSLIRMVLVESGWNIKKSSRILGIARNTLKDRLKRYEIRVEPSMGTNDVMDDSFI